METTVIIAKNETMCEKVMPRIIGEGNYAETETKVGEIFKVAGEIIEATGFNGLKKKLNIKNFMLMQVKVAVGGEVYAFKHFDTRDYMYVVNAEEKIVVVPMTDTPFMRGEYMNITKAARERMAG